MSSLKEFSSGVNGVRCGVDDGVGAGGGVIGAGGGVGVTGGGVIGAGGGVIGAGGGVGVTGVSGVGVTGVDGVGASGVITGAKGGVLNDPALRGAANPGVDFDPHSPASAGPHSRAPDAEGSPVHWVHPSRRRGPPAKPGDGKEPNLGWSERVPIVAGSAQVRNSPAGWNLKVGAVDPATKLITQTLTPLKVFKLPKS